MWLTTARTGCSRKFDEHSCTCTEIRMHSKLKCSGGVSFGCVLPPLSSETVETLAIVLSLARSPHVSLAVACPSCFPEDELCFATAIQLWCGVADAIVRCSFELWHGGKLVAAELGYAQGKIYTSLSGAYNKEYNSAGGVQLAAVGTLLKVRCWVWIAA